MQTQRSACPNTTRMQSVSTHQSFAHMPHDLLVLSNKASWKTCEARNAYLCWASRPQSRICLSYTAASSAQKEQQRQHTESDRKGGCMNEETEVEHDCPHALRHLHNDGARRLKHPER